MKDQVINWFPGHMAKATNKILETLNTVDLVLEVVDARAINATSNPLFGKSNKPILKVALKSDLADMTSVKSSKDVIIGNIKSSGFRSNLIKAIELILKDKKEKLISKGLKHPTFLIMIVGLPNVGKSSLINYLGNKKLVVTGNMPAVTKNQSIIKLTNELFLIDNPGIFFKKVVDITEGYKLALVNTVNKNILPLYEVNKWAIAYLNKHYPEIINTSDYDSFINDYASKRNFITEGNKLDLSRANEALFDDLVNGKICKVNYEIK